MRFFHLGDLHLGKQFHNLPLIERDQPEWVDRFLSAVDEYEVDAVVIAGDVYDRRAPGEDAMALFDTLLTGLAERGKTVLVIPGNHDSALRLSHVNRLLSAHRIHIAGPLTRALKRVDMGDVTFWLMPYLFPKLVAHVLGREELSTYDEAVRALLAEQDMDPARCNVLVAHQNVLAGGVAPEHSGSETIIGGLGEINASAFDCFDYVALGHIHNAQRVGRETVRYAGCPLYYDFSELGRDKSLTLVTTAGKDITVERVPIPLPHELRQFTGTLEELEQAGRELTDRDRVFVQCVLTGDERAVGIMDRLRGAFGSCLVHVKRETNLTGTVSLGGGAAAQGQSMEEQFRLFFEKTQAGRSLDAVQETVLTQLLEQQAGGVYYDDAKDVPERDAADLLDTLLHTLGEVEA